MIVTLGIRSYNGHVIITLDKCSTGTYKTEKKSLPVPDDQYYNVFSKKTKQHFCFNKLFCTSTRQQQFNINIGKQPYCLATYKIIH